MTDVTPSKRCPSQGHMGPNPLPLDEFYKSSSRPDGLTSACKECTDRCNVRSQAKHRDKVLDQTRERARRWRREAKDIVFSHYGQVCACCGSTERLTIDHVNGGGSDHRIALFSLNTGGDPMYRWLIANEFPDGFQTLCQPCNASKREGERCRLEHSATTM